MSRSFAKRVGTARLAVFGAPTACGARLREALAHVGVPGGRVELYGTSRGEVLLSEYAGEARLIHEANVAEITTRDIVFLCEPGDLARHIAAQAPAGTAVIDLVDALPEDARPALFHATLSPLVAPEEQRCFSVPHPLALLIAEVLHPLEVRLGVEEALCVVLRPASDFGEAGIEELREQTVRLLSCAPLPTRTFGRQLAFNVIPEQQLPAHEPRLATRIAGAVAALLQWPRQRFSVRLLAAPVFHGHGVQLHVRLRGTPTVDEVRAALCESGSLDRRADAATPIEATGEVRASLVDVSEDGVGGFWLWLVAGETDNRAAEQAVKLADQLGDL